MVLVEGWEDNIPTELKRWSSHTSYDMRHTTEAIVNIQDTRYLFNLSISQLSPFTELWEEVQIYVYPEPGITPKAIVHFTWPKQ